MAQTLFLFFKNKMQMLPSVKGGQGKPLPALLFICTELFTYMVYYIPPPLPLCVHLMTLQGRLG